jgi:hypothetical protein
MLSTDATYIFITRWPESFAPEQRVEVAVAVTGLEPIYAARRVARGDTVVLTCVESSRAEDITRALRERDVGCAAVREAALRNLDEPVLLKRLVPADGAPQPMFLAEPWRSEPLGILASGIALLVRARLRKTTRRDEVSFDVSPEAGDAAYDMESSFPTSGYPSDRTADVYRRDVVEMIDVVEFVTRDRVRYRIRGDKFNFDFLGASRGLSDNQNCDRLACIVAESAPECAIDTGFAAFRCPREYWHSWRSRTKSREVDPRTPRERCTPMDGLDMADVLSIHRCFVHKPSWRARGSSLR